MNRHHHDDAPWPEGRQAPRLLESLYRFLAKRAEGSLGHFDLEAEAVSAEAGWGPHFAGTTWSFMRLPDGSRMALCEAVQPPAVVYLGSEGDLRTVAESLEQFLIDWAGNEVDVGELALDEDADADELVLMKKARKAFRAWLKKEGVVAPAVEGSFDFSAYAEGDPACRRAPGQGVDSTPPAFSPVVLAALDSAGPTLGALLRLLGRPAQDPALCALVQAEFGKAPPQSIGRARHDDRDSLSHRSGLHLSFQREVNHRDFPPIPVGKKALCPYFTEIHIGSKFKEALPYQLHADTPWAEVVRRFPQLIERRCIGGDTSWVIEGCELPLDAAGQLLMNISREDEHCGFSFRLLQSRIICEHFFVQSVHEGAGVLVQWALERGCLNEDEFSGQAALLEGLRQRTTAPSRLVAAALQRGLWESHLKPEPWLRDFAFAYFHHLDGIWITADLKALFGSREGPHGHDEPVFDDDAAAAFDRIFEVFDRRFKEYRSRQEAQQAAIGG